MAATDEDEIDNANIVILFGRIAHTLMCVFLFPCAIIFGATGGFVAGVVFAVYDIWWCKFVKLTWRNPALRIEASA